MKKFKANKKATRGKIKAWKKGQSSSYNPECQKFRSEAKKKNYMGYQGTNSFLTQSAVAQHNKTDLGSGNPMDEDPNFDGFSVGGESFVSTFSHCTNPSFNRLLKHWRSDSVLHKEMLAVLAAVTEVIQTKGGKETDTEYFAALMTTLDVVENDEATAAVITLLFMIIKRLPDSLLRYNFETTCGTLKKLLLKYSTSEYNAVLRNLLGCLYHFLKAQNGVTWTEMASDIYSTFLEFTVYQKPKVRKCAHNGIRCLLNTFNSSSSDEGCHPTSMITAKFCIEKLESSGGSSQTTFHILNLLHDILGYFPKNTLKSCCETILKTMTLANVITITSCLNVLKGLFMMNPKPENLPWELNVRIIKALYDYLPNINDSVLLSNWLLLMESAFLNLYRLDPKVCLSHLPRFYKEVVKCWLSNKNEVYPAVSQVLNNLSKECIRPTNPEFQEYMLENPIDNPMHKMFYSVESALSYQYHKAWKYVLHVLMSFFDIMGKHSYTVMTKCIQSLADLRETFKFPYIAELDKAFGVAIHKMGPENVLKAVPLQIDIDSGKLDFPRSWLLPLMRDNIKETELGFFIKYFLPLAARLKKKAEECEAEPLQRKTYDILNTQVWSLLPGFCNCPTDLKQSFKNIAEILGKTLTHKKDLRLTVLSSLRTLITRNLDNKENTHVLAYFAKNYLPILFNLYTTESKDKGEESIRLAVYDTIIAYLQITDKAICEPLFLEIMGNLKKNEGFLKETHLDLNRALLPYVDENLITQFYAYCKPLLKDSNRTIQKKSYSVLNAMCSGSSKSCTDFVTKNLEDLKTVLLSSLSISSPSCKALRLSCLQHIINQLSVDNKEFLSVIVPEASLCTKENSAKARTTAFMLLTEIGHVLKKWQPDNSKGVLRDYMQMLLAGFGGSPHMISATILAIGNVIYEFKNDLDSDVLHLLIENICLLMTSKSREVVDSALSFIKILFSTFSTIDLAEHVEYLVKSIANISGDNQRHFRFKAKELFTRLIRKFGYEMISKFAPESFRKQLVNIRKLEARKAKKKSIKDDDSQSDGESSFRTKKTDNIEDILQGTDDELEDENASIKQKSSKKKRMKKDNAWIEERAENDIVDFMDPTVSKKILASKPGTKATKSKLANTFAISEDGRLIINDESEVKPGTSKSSFDIDMVDFGTSSKGKKRKLEMDSDDDNDDNVSSYTGRVVNKGIHRNIAKDVRPGARFKAKKADGDVKKGKFNPYAHITFHRNLLDKRKKKKLQTQFKGLVHSAKKGAKKGMKARVRKSRK